MNINTREIVVKPAETISLTSLDYPFFTMDDPKKKILRVRLYGMFTINITGEEYDALGESWGDKDLLDYIKKKYNFEEKVAEVAQAEEAKSV